MMTGVSELNRPDFDGGGQAMCCGSTGRGGLGEGGICVLS